MKINQESGIIVRDSIQKAFDNYMKVNANYLSYDSSTYGRITNVSPNNLLFTVTINGKEYFNVRKKQGCGTILLNDTVICVLPKNQINNIYIDGVLLSSLRVPRTTETVFVQTQILSSSIENGTTNGEYLFNGNGIGSSKLLANSTFANDLYKIKMSNLIQTTQLSTMSFNPIINVYLHDITSGTSTHVLTTTQPLDNTLNNNEEIWEFTILIKNVFNNNNANLIMSGTRLNRSGISIFNQVNISPSISYSFNHDIEFQIEFLWYASGTTVPSGTAQIFNNIAYMEKL